MGKLIDLTGKVFGRLTVLKRGKTSKWGHIHWACRCSCGNVKEICGTSLKKKNSSSCGCLQKELLTERNKTHGMHGSPEYISWQSMKNRCYNLERDNYHNYGGRGIIVCDRWLNSFENFYEDMGPRPDDDYYSLDRIDSNGNYEPSNCRWATDEEQIINRRTTKINGKKEADHIRKEFATGEFKIKEIADYYDCSRANINDIINNKIWI
jgi:hypothetical protein